MTRVTYPQNPPTRPKFRTRNLIIGLAVAAAGYSLVRFFIDRSIYDKGHEAYRQVNCTVASEQFDRILNGWRLVDFGGFADRAMQEKAECVAFKPALEQEQKGNLGQAIVAYNGFIVNHKKGNYLVENARDRVNSIVEKNKPEKIATKELCGNLKQLQPDLFAQRDKSLPPLHFACADMYASQKDYKRASLMYESFLDEYPKHPLAPKAKTAWAKTLVAQANKEGAGSLPAPEASSSNSGEPPVVTIRNDSPEPMRIVFSGPEGRVEELQACTTCKKFVGQPPKSCPGQGPIGRYTLKPGEYDVVVKSTGNKLVRPFKGTWAMNSGMIYNNCFYIVTNRSAADQQSQP